MSEKKKEPLDPKEEQQRARREFLARALRVAVYVPPVVAVLSVRNLASAQGSAPMPIE